MRILVTNDDGIHAPGLKSAEKIARDLSDDVWVVAPETDQSGMSHSLTLNNPLRLREISDRHFAVSGTPSDCAIMGVRHILDREPDLILSGVNRGQNAAEDLIYSGTVAGALEGSFLGIRSIAMSQVYTPGERRRVPWETAEAHGARVVKQVLEANLPIEIVANINFPGCAPDDVDGVVVTQQGKRQLAGLNVEGRKDGRGNPYYWLVFPGNPPTQAAVGTDIWAIQTNRISVTPMTPDFTNMAAIDHLRDHFPDTRAVGAAAE